MVHVCLPGGRRRCMSACQVGGGGCMPACQVGEGGGACMCGWQAAAAHTPSACPRSLGPAWSLGLAERPLPRCFTSAAMRPRASPAAPRPRRPLGVCSQRAERRHRALLLLLLRLPQRHRCVCVCVCVCVWSWFTPRILQLLPCPALLPGSLTHLLSTPTLLTFLAPLFSPPARSSLLPISSHPALPCPVQPTW